MMPFQHLLQVLTRPDSAFELTLSQWDLLIRQARQALLLSRLSELLQPLDGFSSLPPPVQRHLLAAAKSATARNQAMDWEVNCISEALHTLPGPVILLKGAAYQQAKLAAARGRLFGDVDILVPKAQLEQAEHLLMRAGWLSTHVNRYDQKYYRKWMHELPPMRHVKRRSVIDVHHSILPDTARISIDASQLIEHAIPLEGRPLHTFSPEDMVLHSATHLFHDGELEHGLRDLVDLDSLLRHFADEAAFWPRLFARAEQLSLQRPLYYALHYTAKLLDTPVPDTLYGGRQTGQPNRLLWLLMRPLFDHALAPHHSSCQRPLSGLARWCLYVRAHYLRMPLPLLIPHLLRKSLISEEK